MRHLSWLATRFDSAVKSESGLVTSPACAALPLSCSSAQALALLWSDNSVHFRPDPRMVWNGETPPRLMELCQFISAKDLTLASKENTIKLINLKFHPNLFLFGLSGSPYALKYTCYCNNYTTAYTALFLLQYQTHASFDCFRHVFLKGQ